MKPLKQKQLDSLLATLENGDEYVFLDTARSGEENRYSYLFVRPRYRLEFLAGESPAGFIAELERHLASGTYLAGWMSYEFGYLLEPRLKSLVPPVVKNGTVLASFGVFDEPFVHVHDHGTAESTFPAAPACGDLPSFSVNAISFSQDKESYLNAIAEIKKYIAAGDTYQVNYTLKLLFDFSGSAEAFYRSLRRNQSVAYGAMIHLGSEHILSLSPELFFRIDADRIRVRPMKGTMKRGLTWEQDREQCERLQRDAKNRSENVMIVDLLRNDLARLCRQLDDTAVVTESLFDVEQYESVLQMTSTISAAGKGGVLSRMSMIDVLRALFPCGSVTGAPKIRTMEIIRELEEHPRGVYTGAIGYFSPDGTAAFNVPIRTIRLADGKGEMGIGSGIVHDSRAEQEWQECLLKADFLTKATPAFVLIETLYWEKSEGYFLLDEHLLRLGNSARYFSFSYDREEIMASLDQTVAENRDASDCLRIRLTLAKDGVVESSSQPWVQPLLQTLPQDPGPCHDDLPEIAFSSCTIDSSACLFYHKTSQRELFDREFERAGKESLFDVVFQNQYHEITEGCISNLIAAMDGCYYTPPVTSGLLAGTMRAKLLSESVPKLHEKVLDSNDIRRATALFCCNSVRGVVQVRLRE